MIRDIRAIAQLKKYSELYNVIIIVGATIMMIIINLITGLSELSVEDLRILIPVVVASIFFGFSIFFKVFLMVDEVPRGLSFGMTRRKLFAYSRVVDLLEILVVALLVWVISIDVSLGLVLKIAVLCYGVILWIEGIAGNSVIRYGKVAYWIYYIALMVVCIGLPRLSGFFPVVGDVFATMIDAIITPVYNQGMLWSAILGFAAVGMLINWITFRKIPVNSVT